MLSPLNCSQHAAMKGPSSNAMNDLLLGASPRKRNILWLILPLTLIKKKVQTKRKPRLYFERSRSSLAILYFPITSKLVRFVLQSFAPNMWNAVAYGRAQNWSSVFELPSLNTKYYPKGDVFLMVRSYTLTSSTKIDKMSIEIRWSTSVSKILAAQLQPV